ncbi:MAG: hypothetical protein M3M96_02420, partial [Candidatus Eremiobacteraeota bacterium]|nr:hypothetical protein [Candidatus Eremiobacteraeota bacterium]
VLGFATDGSPLSELHGDSVDVALGRTENLRVEADGSVCYDRTSIDPRTGEKERERVAVGRIALARFPAATKFQQSDAERVLPPQGVVPHLGRPGDGNFTKVAPMHSAASHIDLAASLSRLSDAYLAFDALTAAHKAQGGIGKTAMDLLK